MHTRQDGFSLIELMIVVVIVAILALIAVPSYTSHIAKTRTRGAMADLSSLTLAMESYYQLNLKYPSGNTTTTSATQQLFGSPSSWAPAQQSYFTYTASFDSTGYTLSASGIANTSLAGCTVKLDSSNVKSASGCQVQWE